MSAAPAEICHGSPEMALAAIAETMARVSAHAGAAASYAAAGNIRGTARESRAAAAALLVAADLSAALEPFTRRGGRAA